LSNVSNWSDPNALGFSKIPILEIWFPVIKSGFSSSFSILAYNRALVAPNSL
jgi:hypothetical protein